MKSTGAPTIVIGDPKRKNFMNISENLLKRLADEAESIPNPASDEELTKLKEHNADGDTLEKTYEWYWEQVKDIKEPKPQPTPQLKTNKANKLLHLTPDTSF